jgi:hypothetical protein
MFDAIRELYQAGIDCGVESFQGCGVTAWIVDVGNRRVEKSFGLDELAAIPEWFVSEAISQRLPHRDLGDSRAPRDLLAELTNARRKDARRVSADERHQRRGNSEDQDRRREGQPLG